MDPTPEARPSELSAPSPRRSRPLLAALATYALVIGGGGLGYLATLLLPAELDGRTSFPVLLVLLGGLLGGLASWGVAALLRLRWWLYGPVFTALVLNGLIASLMSEGFIPTSTHVAQGLALTAPSTAAFLSARHEGRWPVAPRHVLLAVLTIVCTVAFVLLSLQKANASARTERFADVRSSGLTLVAPTVRHDVAYDGLVAQDGQLSYTLRDSEFGAFAMISVTRGDHTCDPTRSTVLPDGLIIDRGPTSDYLVVCGQTEGITFLVSNMVDPLHAEQQLIEVARQLRPVDMAWIEGHF